MTGITRTQLLAWAKGRDLTDGDAEIIALLQDAEDAARCRECGQAPGLAPDGSVVRHYRDQPPGYGERCRGSRKGPA